MRIYIADLAAYDEGLLAGEWLDLPSSDIMDDVKDILERTSAQRLEHIYKGDITHFQPSEEWAIHDHEGIEEWYGKVSEYEDIEDLNEACEEYDDLDDSDRKKLGFLMTCQGYDLKDALYKLGDCDLYEGMDYEDLAEEFLDEGLFGEDVSNLWKRNPHYIDVEAIARDLKYDYTEWNGDIFRCD